MSADASGKQLGEFESSSVVRNVSDNQIGKIENDARFETHQEVNLAGFMQTALYAIHPETKLAR